MVLKSFSFLFSNEQWNSTMSQKLIECVPNFSEGRCKDTIDRIAAAISATKSVKLLDVDPGASTNRTVYTFVGGPEDVVEAAFNAARVAQQLIDMRNHSGEHPRLGAMDVCPFVPVRNATTEDCVDCARRLGERLGRELDVPIFLYGFAASADYRRSVPQIRSGEYEGLAARLDQPEWRPDFGPAESRPAWGASMVGARKFLIAYNVNVLGTKEQAHRIALNIREQGRGPGQPGRLTGVQGIGWYLDEHNLAQVSVNILDFEVTPLHRVFKECRSDAAKLGLAVAGSQAVGLLPLKSLMDCAEHYAAEEGLMLLDEDQRVRLAVDRLGLASLGPFDPKQRVIEYLVDSGVAGPLAGLSVGAFVRAVGSRTPAPGGGSVSALVGALGVGLGAMGGLLTYGNRRFEHLDGKMRQLLPPMYSGCRSLLPFVDRDTEAFDAYMAACKAKAEPAKQQELLRDCALVPLELAREVAARWEQLEELAKVVNLNCRSDVQVAAKCMETAIFGACCNVRTNLVSVEDADFKAKTDSEAEELQKHAAEKCQAVLKLLDDRKE
ncbi:hypothetical protein BOX15_Mlig019954g2 [Macrostomum lignano]|uniref:Formimidoyltransferase-cyclodeaminase n=1 Tax=Macrostomum lignano TaxID=282301 RepID=A0A267DDL8_9PLAT|nr:hypothetical protein BOX15_Mlig019954g2 [Macrostomum lignano]